MDFKHLRSKLREIREGALLSQAALSQQLGMVRSAVTNFESGSRIPTLEVIAAWAKICKFTVILDFVPDEDPLNELQQRISELNSQDRTMVLEFAQMWPHLNMERRIAIRALLDAWRPSLSSDDAQMAQKK